MEKLILKTERLKLVACDETLLEDIIEGKLTKYKFAEEWITKDSFEALPTFLSMQKTGESLGGWGIWLVILKGTNLVLGGCGFIGNPDKSGAVEIGYSISSKYRRQGYTIEACKALIDMAFAHDNVKYIKATCEMNNVASIKLLEKLGMKFSKSNKKRILEFFLMRYN